MAPSSSRNGVKPIWVVVHTAEGIRKASDLKAYFDRSTNSSSHAVADDATLIEGCVPYERAAWTLRDGNARSDNLELCGFAAWSRAEWLDQHRGMLDKTRLWTRARCAARGLPFRKLSAAEVGQGKAGVLGHTDYTNGTGDGTHWDPGPGFPWDYVMEEQDMNQDEHNMLVELLQRVQSIHFNGFLPLKGSNFGGDLTWFQNQLSHSGIKADIAELLARPPVEVHTDTTALAQALIDAGYSGGATIEQIEQVIAGLVLVSRREG